jgi:hypothetical protein
MHPAFSAFSRVQSLAENGNCGAFRFIVGVQLSVEKIGKQGWELMKLNHNRLELYPFKAWDLVASQQLLGTSVGQPMG